jgi:hypothetical protein
VHRPPSVTCFLGPSIPFVPACAPCPRPPPPYVSRIVAAPPPAPRMPPASRTPPPRTAGSARPRRRRACRAPLIISDDLISDRPAPGKPADGPAARRITPILTCWSLIRSPLIRISDGSPLPSSSGPTRGRWGESGHACRCMPAQSKGESGHADKWARLSFRPHQTVSLIRSSLIRSSQIRSSLIRHGRLQQDTVALSGETEQTECSVSLIRSSESGH